MKFNPKARIDQSQYSDAGGRPGGSSAGLRLPIPSGGGGRLTVGGVVIVVVVFFVTQFLNGSPTGSDSTECRTGADANASDKCASALLATSVQDYWARNYAEQAPGAAFAPRTTRYEPAGITTFSSAVDTGCGQAGAEMGPFYCPNDQTVYVAENFLSDMLEGDLQAEGGPFALGYVVAHEYGHHVEDLLGYLGRIRTQQGERSDSVKAELMADCLGGIWAKNAQQTVDGDGNAIIEDLTAEDVQNAIGAATAVGDDRIQPRASKESWTHGSAADRVKWFMIGYQQGSLAACDTFRDGAL
ncbi:MAG: neutral zinc metallopeptidase [Propionibacteriales bacterium]|nr:neutral zinc metallopeptidase [Propionibacteriales bacterium]